MSVKWVMTMLVGEGVIASSATCLVKQILSLIHNLSHPGICVKCGKGMANWEWDSAGLGDVFL